MKYSTLTALIGTSAAGIGHKAEMSTLHKTFKHEIDGVKSAGLMELSSDKFYGSSGYQALSASAKSDDIWSQVSATAGTSGAFPTGVSLGGIFFEAMAPSFETVADAMPDTWYGETRVKYIHSVGVVSKCKFVSTGDHSFTGIFEGADYGFCRLSAAGEPSSSLPLTPALALKFLRNGKPSSDLVALYSVNGNPEGDWNFFSQDLSNHIPAPHGIPLDLLGDKFASYTNYIQEVGLSNYSDFDQDGNATANVFPFKLRFHPNSSVQKIFPTELQNEDYMGYTTQLESIPADTNIYDVYATDKPLPLGGKETLIGSIKMDGKFTTTKWGDQNMFFQHQIITDDLKIQPDWKPYYSQHSLGGKCPFQMMSKDALKTEFLAMWGKF